MFCRRKISSGSGRYIGLHSFVQQSRVRDKREIGTTPHRVNHTVLNSHVRVNYGLHYSRIVRSITLLLLLLTCLHDWRIMMRFIVWISMKRRQFPIIRTLPTSFFPHFAKYTALFLRCIPSRTEKKRISNQSKNENYTGFDVIEWIIFNTSLRHF